MTGVDLATLALATWGIIGIAVGRHTTDFVTLSIPGWLVMAIVWAVYGPFAFCAPGARR